MESSKGVLEAGSLRRLDDGVGGTQGSQQEIAQETHNGSCNLDQALALGDRCCLPQAVAFGGGTQCGCNRVSWEITLTSLPSLPQSPVKASH